MAAEKSPRRMREEGEPLHTQLSRRESQIMDVIYRLKEGTVSDVVSMMPDEPGYNTVRVTLGILEKKGFVRHRQDGQRYVYSPTVPVERARRSVMSHILRTFFQGSTSQAILALLDTSSGTLTQADLDEISRWIEEAKQREGK